MNRQIQYRLQVQDLFIYKTKHNFLRNCAFVNQICSTIFFLMRNPSINPKTSDMPQESERFGIRPDSV